MQRKREYREMKEKKKRSPAFYGSLAALALIASYVESLVPLPVPVPGIRLGLANAVVLAALELFGLREAFLVSVVRIVLAGFLFGNLSAVFYSLGGGLLSLAVIGASSEKWKIWLSRVSVWRAAFLTTSGSF